MAMKEETEDRVHTKRLLNEKSFEVLKNALSRKSDFKKDGVIDFLKNCELFLNAPFSRTDVAFYNLHESIHNNKPWSWGEFNEYLNWSTGVHKNRSQLYTIASENPLNEKLFEELKNELSKNEVFKEYKEVFFEEWAFPLGITPIQAELMLCHPLHQSIHEKNPMNLEEFNKILGDEQETAKVITYAPALVLKKGTLFTDPSDLASGRHQRTIDLLNRALYKDGFIKYSEEKFITSSYGRCVSFSEKPYIRKNIRGDDKYFSIEYVSCTEETRLMPSYDFKMPYFKRFLSEFKGDILALGRQGIEEFHDKDTTYAVDLEYSPDFFANAFDKGTTQYFLNHTSGANKFFKFIFFERLGLRELIEGSVSTPRNEKQDVKEILVDYADCLQNDGYIVVIGGMHELLLEDKIKLPQSLKEITGLRGKRAEITEIKTFSPPFDIEEIKNETNSLDNRWDEVFPERSAKELNASDFIIFMNIKSFL